MLKKIDILTDYMNNNEWESAIKLAASFPRLGPYKVIIQRAKEAILRPDF